MAALCREFRYEHAGIARCFRHDAVHDDGRMAADHCRNLVGFAFAVIVLATSVVSLPMLIDRHGDPMTAVATSIRATWQNATMMIVWGLIVAALLAIGALLLLVGLAVVLPVLGYATWHLYTRLIER